MNDYDERRAKHLDFWKSASGQQSGDSAKLAQALITLVNQPELPRRFIAGADAIGMVEQKIALLQQQIAAYRELSSSLAFDVKAWIFFCRGRQQRPCSDTCPSNP
ncbi:short-chain dehydrogenase domain-containing protein (plasmid) [Rhizobium gallicum bv. gallicum R602sp]|uniref:Short-chain dehydrogenase domain-containing protein n=1 Tax=Rhizobium gallicum bv. gallicum R602sp TaxID=1041138 RepID=A0A0B4XC47_9HYPH|nr:short-chain dehydrogenase domain-containing protein [Rhizobium gallicum bv. gallicum R602sp]